MVLRQNLKIYDKDPTSNAITLLLMEGAYENLVHETRLPGGFWTLSFTIPMTVSQYTQWRDKRILFRLKLEAEATETLWEGRLEDLDGPVNSPVLKFRGYWSNFTDAVTNDGAYSKSYNTTADAIVKDMLDNGFNASTSQINLTDQSNIVAPGTTIDQDYSDDLNLWQVLTRPNGILSYGDSNDNPVDLAVLEDRVVHLTIRNPLEVTWRAYIGAQSGVVDAPFHTSWRDVATAVSQLYNGTTESARSVDAAAVTRTLRRERVLPNIGTSQEAPAVSRSDIELANANDLQQRTDLIKIDRVWDVNGISQSVCKIRAGDVLQIPDLVPTSSGLVTPDLDATRTFVVLQTTCDHRAGFVTIRPDRESQSQSAQIARSLI